MSGRRDRLSLDRMAIEEAGTTPENIAAAIHDQLGLSRGPAPISDIARALDIVEIRRAPLKSFEAALVTMPERDVGKILVNASSSEQRRRFSIAHELGHFLNVWHKPTETPEGGGFACRKEDIGTWKPKSLDSSRHALQEAQANRFAIELLAPKKFFKAYLRGIPDLDAVLQLSPLLNLSREAVARRYVELHDTPTAVVFSHNGFVRYVERQGDFPALAFRQHSPTPVLPDPVGADNLSGHADADWRDWLRRRPQGDLVVQTLHQHGFSITLLAIEGSEGDDDEA